MKKKLMALLLAAVLFGSFAGSLPANAAQYTEENITNLILNLKDLLDITDEYTEFSQSVWEDEDGPRWSLSWNTPDYNKTVYVNADSEGRIRNYNRYESVETDNVFPKEFSEYYEKTALEFIKKAAPEIDGHISLDNVSLGYYGNTYDFVYIRFENGYPLTDNTVRVSVNHNSNQVTSFSTSWNYDVKFKKPETILTKDEAKAKLNGKLKMELQYLTKWSEGEDSVFLAYVPSGYYYSVDAKTGKIYTEKNYYNYDYEYSAEEAKEVAMNDMEQTGRASLTEAEIKSIKEVTSLISKEDAVKVITSNKNLLLDKNLSKTTAYLTSYGDGYAWIIRMNDTRPVDYSNNDYYRAYVNATVDAKDGRLLNFFASVKDYYDDDDVQNVELKYNKKECIKKFEKFAKTMEPEIFAQTKKTSDYGGYTIYYDYKNDKSVYGGRYFVYSRLVNDIPFSNNYISGGVDRVTGKVYSYSCEWNDKIVFPSPEKVISAKKAFNSYLDNDDFAIRYELYYNTKIATYESKTTVNSRLCYVAGQTAAYVDAFTGKRLNYYGDEYKPVSKNRIFTDIAGHKYEKEIRFITQLMNNYGGDQFEPDKEATYEFVTGFFNKLWYFYRTPQNLKNDDKAITREELAAVLVEALGYKKIAGLDIFKADVKDASKISKQNKGAVALSVALGLFETDKNGKFNPTGKVTRGEAAAAFANALIANDR